jgi:hypothetical protein
MVGGRAAAGTEAWVVAMMVVPSSTSKGAAGVVAVSSVHKDVGGSGGSKGKPGRLRTVRRGAE